MKPDFITNNDWELVKKLYPDKIDEMIDKLNNNYPIQYMIGYVDFYDTKIKVNENVLIPRFETEYLVEKVYYKLKDYPKNSLNIVDIGTGSGCIIISLAKKIQQQFEGIDISPNALQVARENAILNQVNIKFQKMDILTNTLSKNYDVIISNPPYVSKTEEVDPKIKFEPQNAIYAQKNGLEFYERILSIIPNTPKLIAFEIGMTQKKEIMNMAQKKFPNSIITVEKDLTGKDRYIFIEHR